MWWVRADCCGIFCAAITVLLMFYAAFVQIYFVLGPWKGYFSVHVIIYLSLVLLGAISHTRCQFTNPGTVPTDDSSLKNDLESNDEENIDKNNHRLWCQYCNRTKPSEAHHCSTCSRCILKMDHHCPWVNNCVAIFNQKFFLQFLLYTGCQCLYCLVSITSRFIICTNRSSTYNSLSDNHNNINQIPNHYLNDLPLCDAQTADIFCTILNFIEGILFGLFTFIMLYDQLSAIFSNTPYIDKIKGRKGAQKKRYECLKDVFGEPFNIRWFFPTPLTHKIQKDFEAMCSHFTVQ